jgi:hypothetical protein
VHGNLAGFDSFQARVHPEGSQRLKSR